MVGVLRRPSRGRVRRETALLQMSFRRLVLRALGGYSTARGRGRGERVCASSGSAPRATGPPRSRAAPGPRAGEGSPGPSECGEASPVIRPRPPASRPSGSSRFSACAISAPPRRASATEAKRRRTRKRFVSPHAVVLPREAAQSQGQQLQPCKHGRPPPRF